MPAANATPQGDNILLEVADLTLRYKSHSRLVTAVWKIGFRVRKGDRFVLLGPSGCGKSSVLKAVGGFLKPAAGQITLEGRPVCEPGPDRIMVFQDFEQLLPWLTVRQNVLFPMRVSRRCSRDEACQRADVVIDAVGLRGFSDAFPHTLSGGMKMRVAIARALAMRPQMLLMDEPFAALDALTRHKMQKELLVLWGQTEFTMLFVTHSIDEAILLGSRILVLTAHPGRVRAEIAADNIGRTDSAVRELKQQINDLLFEPHEST